MRQHEHDVLQHLLDLVVRAEQQQAQHDDRDRRDERFPRGVQQQPQRGGTRFEVSRDDEDRDDQNRSEEQELTAATETQPHQGLEILARDDAHLRADHEHRGQDREDQHGQPREGVDGRGPDDRDGGDRRGVDVRRGGDEARTQRAEE